MKHARCGKLAQTYYFCQCVDNNIFDTDPRKLIDGVKE
jgi:hypothetical protein